MVLKECPFCGNKNVVALLNSQKRPVVECLRCYANGPHDASFDGAVDAWNNRIGWVSVKQRLPKEDLDVPYVSTDSSGFAYYSDGEWWSSFDHAQLRGRKKPRYWYEIPNLQI